MRHYLKIFVVAIIICSINLTSCNKTEEVEDLNVQDQVAGILKDGDFSFPGVSVLNGMLYFKDLETFEFVYNTLDELTDGYYGTLNPIQYGLEGLDACATDFPVLDDFEEFYGFYSKRKQAEEQECILLNDFVAPEDIIEPLLVDDVFLSLLNVHYQVRIGDELHMLLDEDYAVAVEGANYDVLAEIQLGASPLAFEGTNIRKVSGKRSSCFASFTASTNPSTNSANFNFTGSPSFGPNVTITWTLGDGTTNSGTSISKTYPGPGTYTVCVTVKDLDEPCEDTYCEDVRIGDECQARFDWTEGGFGVVNFTDMSTAGSTGTITSWLWTFGDGNSSTLQHPTHTYDCNLDAQVRLTITTSAGCQDVYERKIPVRNVTCCSAKAKLGWETKSYSGGSKRIKYKQRQVQWLLGKKIKAKMKNYKQKNSGKWKKEKANLMIELSGNVYTMDENNCRCKKPFSIASTKSSNGKKKKLKIKKPIGDKYDSKENFEWEAHYFVSGNNVEDAMTPVICD